MTTGTAVSQPNSDAISLNPSYRPFIELNAIGNYGQASLTRVLAHEFGHAVFGTPDDGPKHMHNVNLNENPIMEALGEGTRMSYRDEI